MCRPAPRLRRETSASGAGAWIATAHPRIRSMAPWRSPPGAPPCFERTARATRGSAAVVVGEGSSVLGRCAAALRPPGRARTPRARHAGRRPRKRWVSRTSTSRDRQIRGRRSLRIVVPSVWSSSAFAPSQASGRRCVGTTTEISGARSFRRGCAIASRAPRRLEHPSPGPAVGEATRALLPTGVEIEVACATPREGGAVGELPHRRRGP